MEPLDCFVLLLRARTFNYMLHQDQVLSLKCKEEPEVHTKHVSKDTVQTKVKSTVPTLCACVHAYTHACLPSPWLICLAFYVGAGDKTQVLMFVWQVLQLLSTYTHSECPSLERKPDHGAKKGQILRL